MWIRATSSAKKIGKVDQMTGSVLFHIFLQAPILLLFVSCTHSNKPPAARKDPVTNSYHGITVTDDYRWLEDWNNPQVQRWSENQNVFARKYLDAIPQAARIRRQVTGLMKQEPEHFYSLSSSGGRLFALKKKPPANQPALVMMASPDELSSEKVILDPNQLDSKGTITIDWFKVSPDGKLAAVSLSSSGSERGDLHLYETATGREMSEVIPHVQSGTAGGSLAWTPDSSGFYYTRYPRQGERPASDLDFYQELWFHKLGTAVKDDHYELGKEFERIAEIEVELEKTTGLLLAQVQLGDSGRFAFYIRTPEGKWNPMARYEDEIVEAVFRPGGGIFMISRKDAPRGKVLRLSDAKQPLNRAKVIIPEGKDHIVTSFYHATAMLATPDRLYLIYQRGGPSEIRAFDHNGKPAKSPKIPPVSDIDASLVAWDGDDVLFLLESYTEPADWYRFEPVTGALRKTAFIPKYPVNFADSEVVRKFVTSKDGTQIPLNILRRKGIRLDGKNPVILSGYGGYAVSEAPGYNQLRRIWLDQGGIYAYANLRGGAEFGETWHRDGMLARKQNVFDDFAACMNYLVKSDYTSPERLVIVGGSNGGLLMGAMIAQHPESARTVISFVGIYDMLRNELTPNGSFNIPEYGTVNNLDQFRALYSYSPYHRIQDGIYYPAVLFLTGANDPRVDPMHSRKMTARLQAATASGLPILLRTSANTGHGIGSSLAEKIEEQVDVFAFLFDRLKIENR